MKRNGKKLRVYVRDNWIGIKAKECHEFIIGCNNKVSLLWLKNKKIKLYKDKRNNEWVSPSFKPLSTYKSYYVCIITKKMLDCARSLASVRLKNSQIENFEYFWEIQAMFTVAHQIMLYQYDYHVVLTWCYSSSFTKCSHVLILLFSWPAFDFFLFTFFFWLFT